MLCSNQTVAGLKQSKAALEEDDKMFKSDRGGIETRFAANYNRFIFRSNQTVAGLKQANKANVEIKETSFKSDRGGIETPLTARSIKP